jgi:DNA invertase Pin-like site-specific DNA recombinase
MEEQRRIVAIYIRTDTKGDGEKISDQLMEIHEVTDCSIQDIEIYDFLIDDGIPGDTPFKERPQGSKLLKLAKEGRINEVLATDVKVFGTSFKLVQNLFSILSKLDIAFTPLKESLIPEFEEFGCIFDALADLVDFDINEQRKMLKQKNEGNGKQN